MICPRCDAVVSDDAVRCPHCKKRLKPRRIHPLFLLLAVALGLALGFWTAWSVPPDEPPEREVTVSTAYEDSEMAALVAENRRLKDELDSMEEKLAAARRTEATEPAPTETTTRQTSADFVELKAGETWVVDGLWELTLHDVRATDRRDPSVEEEPAEVIIVRYSFTNLGFEDEVNGSNLLLWPDRVIDGEGELGDYYSDVGQEFPVAAPIGATYKNGEQAFALNHKSDTVSVIFSHYDLDVKRHQVTYVDVPVEHP